jgi:hypothetical protein
MLKKAAFSPAQPWRAKTRLVPGKAAASEEARRYVPHFVGPFARIKWIMANGKAPTVFPTSEKFPLRVEPLSEARTPNGERRISAHQGRAGEKSDFFSILQRKATA